MRCAPSIGRCYVLRPALAVALVGCGLLAAVTAAAATPGRFQTPPPAASVPDTAIVEFLPSGVGPSPVAINVMADTVEFGGSIAVAWDLPAGSDPAAFRAPAPKGDQLAPVPATARGKGASGAKAENDAGSLPAGAGPRVIAKYLVYTTDAFRLQWKGQPSRVITVRGRVTDPSKLAAIRDPRAWPWFTWTLGLLLLVATLLAAGGWWLWRRWRRGQAPADWPLPEPAWLAAALACRELLAAHHVERGEARPFLDGLAGIARRFAAAHYGIAAAEMTGCELVVACGDRGHEPALPAAMGRLIDGADLHRYDPEPPSPAWCREQTLDLVARIGEARVMPRLTPVAAERLLAAQQAWAEVSAEVSGAARDQGAWNGGGR